MKPLLLTLFAVAAWPATMTMESTFTTGEMVWEVGVGPTGGLQLPVPRFSPGLGTLQEIFIQVAVEVNADVAYLLVSQSSSPAHGMPYVKLRFMDPLSPFEDTAVQNNGKQADGRLKGKGLLDGKRATKKEVGILDGVGPVPIK